MTPLELPQDEMEKLASLQIRRKELAEPQISKIGGSHFLWLNWPPFKRIVEQVLLGVLGVYPSWRKSKTGGEYVLLSEAQANEFNDRWARLPPVVVVEDLTDLTVAMSFNKEKPESDRTEIGELVHRAKYDRSEEATKQLCDRASETVSALRIFSRVDYVVPVPSSKLAGGNSLPHRVAQAISETLGAEFRPDLVRTLVPRQQLKDLTRAEKLLELQGKMGFGEIGALDSVLIVDDHYQSGVTLNYIALALKHAGSDFASVYGFACDKTLSNQDNVPERRSK